jgi:hypothetical protein
MPDTTDEPAEPLQPVSATVPSTRQRFFLRYLMFILIDLVVLNLLAEYWDKVELTSFTVSLFAAILLQVLLKLTMQLEHQVAGYFKKKSGHSAKVMRVLATWSVLLVSKLIMLAAIDLLFGDALMFHGPHHILVFIIVVVAILVAEELVARFVRWIR